MLRPLTVALVLLSMLAASGRASRAAAPPDGFFRNDDEPPLTDYHAFLGRYAPRLPNDQWLAVWVVDERAQAMAADHGASTIYLYSVSATGQPSGCSISNWGVFRGDGEPRLPKATMDRLRLLAAKLPDDGGRLPPPGRRLLIHVADGHGGAIRVYDRAALPDEIVELCRISRSGAESVVPLVKPIADVEAARGHVWRGIVAVLPNDKSILFAANGHAARWEPATQEALGDVYLPNVSWQAFGVSPDGTRAYVSELNSNFTDLVVDPRTWKVVREFRESHTYPTIRGRSDPWFTPDGKYLFVRTTVRANDAKTGNGQNEPMLPGLYVYDTQTWALAEPPFLPPHCVGYRQATTRPVAVAEVTGPSSILLWDVAGLKAVATLDTGTRLVDAAFSPDGSTVAVHTATELTWDGTASGEHRIRLFDVATGQPRHELCSGDATPPYSPRGLAWSADGHYVLAASVVSEFLGYSGVSVWDARTGRHRVQLTSGAGSPPPLGFAVLQDTGRVAAGFQDGHIRLWDLDAAVRQTMPTAVPK